MKATTKNWKTVFSLLCFAVLFTANSATPTYAQKASVARKNSMSTHTTIEIKTSKGAIVAALRADRAPETVKNFLSYIEKKHYDNTIFHRVMPNFMIQGGGFSPSFEQKKTDAPVKIESDNGLKNTRGTLAMARTQDPNSATAQFFINLVDNAFLNFSSKTVQGYGYTVFGSVQSGMDVVDAIAKVQTGNHGPHQNVPREQVLIESIRVIEQ